MNKLLLGIGAIGLVLALGRKQGQEGTGPPVPVILTPAPAGDARSRVNVLDIEVLEPDTSAVDRAKAQAGEDATTHYIVDEHTIVQLVQEDESLKDGQQSIRIEVLGQSPGAVDAAAWIVARAAAKWSIPLRLLAGDTIESDRGVSLHSDTEIEVSRKALIASVKRYR